MFARSSEFVVGAVGTTPSLLQFVRLKTIPPSSQNQSITSPKPADPKAAPTAASNRTAKGDSRADYEEVRLVVHGEPFQIMAIFDLIPNVDQPKQREVTLEWIDKSPQKKKVVMNCNAQGLCVSPPMVVEEPKSR